MKIIKFLAIISFLSINILNAQTNRKARHAKATAKTHISNIYYDFDKATLRPSSIEDLAKVAARMKSNPNLKVEISGYSDETGESEYMQKLSEDRVQVVVYRLQELGIDIARITTIDYAKTTTINATKKAHKKNHSKSKQSNRRVKLKVA